MLPKDAKSNSALSDGITHMGICQEASYSAAQSGCPHILQDIPVGPGEDCGDHSVGVSFQSSIKTNSQHQELKTVIQML